MPLSPTAAARVCFMIGDPIAHAVMPARVNAWAAETGRDAMMTPLKLPAAAVPAFFEALRGMENAAGAVVTAPHKYAALAACDRLTDDARLVGAVNVVIRQPDGQLLGDNTDGPGFVAAMAGHGVVPDGLAVLQFGCGGAGSSIAAALVRGGARVDLVDPAADKADALARRLGAPARAVPGPASVAGYGLVVNATAIGLDGAGLVHPLDGLDAGALVADVVTKPPVTPFLERALSRGAAIQPGAEMATAQVPLVLTRFGIS